MLTDGLSTIDQGVPTPKIKTDYFVALADRVIGQSLEEGNFDLAFAALEGLRTINKATSLGVCRLLHGVKSHWKDIESEETFLQQAVRKTGYSKETIERYVAVWEFLNGDYVPEEFRDSFWEQTMRQLVKVSETVVSQEYELDHDDWRDLSEAIDDRRTMEVCQSAKGKERNKNHMSLKVNDKGEIWAYQGRKEKCIGMLSLYDKDELVQKAVRRIMDSSGITKRNEY